MTVASYNVTNQQRDLLNQVHKLVVGKPFFLNLFPHLGVYRNNKHEWLQSTLKPLEVAYSSATAVGVFTFADADSAAKFDVGSLVMIKGKSALLKVESISGAAVTTSFVASQGSGLTDETIPTGAGVLKYHSQPKEEGSSAGRFLYSQSSVDYNYTQIERTGCKLTNSAEEIATYGNENVMGVQFQEALYQHYQAINHSAIFGVRKARTSSVNGSAGGLYEFGSASDVPTVNANSGAATIKLINDAAQKLLDNGGAPSLIICNGAKKRVIGSLLSSVIRYDRTDTVRGSYVDSVVCDTTGGEFKVYVDNNIPDTDVWIVDPTGFGLYTSPSGRYFKAWDTGDKKDDAHVVEVLSEFTFMFNNPQARLCRIYGLKASASSL